MTNSTPTAAGVSIRLDDLTRLRLNSGSLDKFVASWNELLSHVQDALDAAGAEG